MKNNTFGYIISFLFLVLFLFSCSTTKHVPEGMYLLDEVRIVSTDKEVKPTNLQNYIRQNSNSKWFSLVKVPLNTYSLSGRDSTKWINKTLRRMGEAPVIYDEKAATRSQEELTKALNNMGYMSASVDIERKITKKKLRLTYRLKPNKPYHIRSITYDIKDREIMRFLEQDSANTKLVEGMKFNTNVLDEERQRITNNLMQKGYYKFNKEYISYRADTVRNTFLVDLTMLLALYRPTNNTEPKSHARYKVNSISYMLDDEIIHSPMLATKSFNDSLHHNGYPIYYRNKPFLRPKVLRDNTRIRKDLFYNEQAVQNTYSYFGRLRALKYTNIRFLETQEGDSTKLDCYIMLTRGKYKSASVELEGTNSAGDLGAAASLSYQHRNMFRGSETFTAKLRGAYEAITGQGYNNDHYTEYGVETSLNFPSFMFPFLSSNFKRRIRATSEVGLQFSSQQRPEFTRTIASASWSYKWTMRQRTNHTVDLIDINYVYPWMSQRFKEEYIDKLNNSILKYNYENLFIMRTGYSFNFNSVGSLMNKTAFDNSYTVRMNIESAGNLLYGISKLTKQKPNEDGNYTVGNIAYAQYIKGDFDYAKNITIDERNSFAFHIGLGIAYPYGNATMLPFEKRYFAGGANSVRGWSVRTLGPGSFKGEDKNIDFMNQSGDIKLDLSVEYRTHLFWKLQGAAFIDAGNIWTIRDYKDQPGGQFKIDSFYKEIAVAYGLGVRFDFDFFILRFDAGMKAINPAYQTDKEHYPIANPKLGRDFAFHFAVGYPF